MDMREKVLEAARLMAQARGYNGLNFRDLAAEVGIKSPSLYHHFETKADLGAAVARRYWEDSKARLDALEAESADPRACLRAYPGLFRRALENENRMCLCGFMAAEYDDLPDTVRLEVARFADVHVEWLASMVWQAGMDDDDVRARNMAEAIFAAIGGAQLQARGRSDIAFYDAAIDGYRQVGLLPD